MTGWLLDTNILSELWRPKRSTKVVSFVASKPLEALFISIVTFAEIRFGIEGVADAIRRAEQNDWLAQKVRPMLEQRALPVSEGVMFKWRLLVADGRKTGRYLFPTRSNHRRDGASSWANSRYARHERLQKGACASSQPVARGRCRITEP